MAVPAKLSPQRLASTSGAPLNDLTGFPHPAIRARTEAGAGRRADTASMDGRSYAAVWQEPGGAVLAGRLELRPSYVLLEGTGPSGDPWLERISYEELEDVRIGRSPSERLGGRPVLVIERRGGGALRVASVDGAGFLHEIAQRLDERRAQARRDGRGKTRSHNRAGHRCPAAPPARRWTETRR